MIPRISILEQKMKTYYKFHFVTIRHENGAYLAVFIERNPLNAVMALTDPTAATHFSSLSMITDRNGEGIYGRMKSH